MKVYAISIGAAALLLAGCNRASEEQLVENAVGNTLASQGNVQSVDLSVQADNNYSGSASVRRADGVVVRLNCTARRAAQAGNFDILCGQVLDQALLDEMKGHLRQSLESQGLTVTQIEMSRRDEDNAAGTATVRDQAGNEAQLTCTGTRQPTGQFGARCQSAGGPAQPAAAQGAAPAEEGAAPAEEAPAEQSGN